MESAMRFGIQNKVQRNTQLFLEQSKLAPFSLLTDGRIRSNGLLNAQSAAVCAADRLKQWPLWNFHKKNI